MIGVDAFFNTRNERLAELALRSGVPTVAPYKEFAEAGGLLSYGAGIARASRQVGVYTGRILGGEKPTNLPFQLPS
jgi:putative ABC transport system substrate-binding protein